jgi:UDP-glucose 4-epimerase
MTGPHTCVVTGGAGFIGSHLVDRLMADGHRVVVIDDYSTGRPENLARHRSDPRFELVEADVVDYQLIRPHFENAAWVFHLAALADIIPSIRRPMDYHRSNVDGTVSVLEAARAARVKRFVYAASSSCYGIPDAYPTEETAEIRPEYPYALTKHLAEQYVLHWGRVYGLPAVSLRLFNVYGPRSRTSGAYGAVFGVFLAQKLAGKPMTVVGDGTQTRDFVFVADVAEAFVLAASSEVAQTVLNVGSGHTHRVGELAELLGGDVTHVPKRPGEPDCTLADVGKIRSLLGWQPKVSFRRGVEIMLRHIDDWQGAPVWTPEQIHVATKDWFECLQKQD